MDTRVSQAARVKPLLRLFLSVYLSVVAVILWALDRVRGRAPGLVLDRPNPSPPGVAWCPLSCQPAIPQVLEIWAAARARALVRAHARPSALCRTRSSAQPCPSSPFSPLFSHHHPSSNNDQHRTPTPPSHSHTAIALPHRSGPPPAAAAATVITASNHRRQVDRACTLHLRVSMHGYRG